MASGEGHPNPSTSGDAGGDNNEDFGNEYGPPLPTQEELREMEHRRLVGEATNLMLNFAKDPKLAKCMSETASQDMQAQWKATTTSPPKPDSKKQFSGKELEEEIDTRLARILGAQKQGKKYDRKQKKSTDFLGYLGSQSIFDKDKKHKKRAAVPGSSSSSDSSSESKGNCQGKCQLLGNFVGASFEAAMVLEFCRNRCSNAGDRMDGYKEEGSSSQDRQSNPTVHEVGEGSSQAEEGFPHAAFSITGTASPGTLFGGKQSMVPNPMYANIGLHPGFQSTQGQFGVSQGNLGMAGFSIPPVNMTPRHQHVTGQGVQMAPTGVSIMHTISFDNLESMDKPKSYDSLVKHNELMLSVQLTKTIGDFYLKYPDANGHLLQGKFKLNEPLRRPILSADPTIKAWKFKQHDKFCVFASDGLWEQLSNEEVCEIVHTYPRSGVARKLIRAALTAAAKRHKVRYEDLKKLDKKSKRMYHDDITVVVVFIDHGKEESVRLSFT
ncbi:hypothetical protein L7F22_032836 [Adiantum nelumboides]|nr:hypothetical protein [Adiantum nelumboides]